MFTLSFGAFDTSTKLQREPLMSTYGDGNFVVVEDQRGVNAGKF